MSRLNCECIHKFLVASYLVSRRSFCVGLGGVIFLTVIYGACDSSSSLILNVGEMYLTFRRITMCVFFRSRQRSVSRGELGVRRRSGVYSEFTVNLCFVLGPLASTDLTPHEHRLSWCGVDRTHRTHTRTHMTSYRMSARRVRVGNARRSVGPDPTYLRPLARRESRVAAPSVGYNSQFTYLHALYRELHIHDPLDLPNLANE